MWVWSLGWEDPPGGGNGNPLQCSCLENSMDQGAWWAAVHEVAKNQTQLSMHMLCYGAVSNFPAYIKFAFYVEDVIYHGYLDMGKMPFPYPSWISRVYCIIICFDKKLIPRFSYFLHCELFLFINTIYNVFSIKRIFHTVGFKECNFFVLIRLRDLGCGV